MKRCGSHQALLPRILLLLGISLLIVQPVVIGLDNHAVVVCSRRGFVTVTTGSLVSIPPAGCHARDHLQDRLESEIVEQPPVTNMRSELNSGVDNLYFPNFVQGTWQVTQTLVAVSFPLGLAYAGGPNGVESIANRTLQDARDRLNVPVQFQLRYLPTQWGVAEDRLFNTRQRLDAFAGRSVVATVAYADVGASNRASVLAMGGTVQDPLQTTIVRFKGPAAQKTFVTGHGSSSSSRSSSSSPDQSWTGYELQRTIFALTNTNTAPPITTDQEIIFNLQLIDENHIRGRLRLAGYLTPTDRLYFDARKRAVSLQDYTLDMVRSITE